MNYAARENIRKAFEYNRMDTLIQLSREYVEEFRSSDIVKKLYESREFEKIEKLIDSCVWSVNMQDSDGKTLAHYAASNGDLEYIQNVLAPKGADLNIQDVNGSSPLHYAAVKDAFFSEEDEIGKVIGGYVQLGASLNTKNRRGETVIDVYNRIRPKTEIGGWNEPV